MPLGGTDLYTLNLDSSGTAAATQTGGGGFTFDLGQTLSNTLDSAFNYLGVLGQIELQGEIAQEVAETNAYINQLNNEANAQNQISPQTQAASSSSGFVWKPWMTYTAIGAAVLVGGIVIVKAL